MNRTAKYLQAKRKVAALKGFYIHFAVFALVMTILMIVNSTAAGRWWVHWPFLGWGCGVVLHAALVFGGLGRVGREWEKREVDELMKE